MLLWGPGGHGKSEMVMAALRSMGYSEEQIFLQSFGEGMSEDRLWGGPNIAKLDVCLEYDTARSFLPYEVVVLEEISRCILAGIAAAKRCIDPTNFHEWKYAC